MKIFVAFIVCYILSFGDGFPGANTYGGLYGGNQYVSYPKHNAYQLNAVLYAGQGYYGPSYNGYVPLCCGSCAFGQQCEWRGSQRYGFYYRCVSQFFGRQGRGQGRGGGRGGNVGGQQPGGENFGGQQTGAGVPNNATGGADGTGAGAGRKRRAAGYFGQQYSSHGFSLYGGPYAGYSGYTPSFPPQYTGQFVRCTKPATYSLPVSPFPIQNFDYVDYYYVSTLHPYGFDNGYNKGYGNGFYKGYGNNGGYYVNGFDGYW